MGFKKADKINYKCKIINIIEEGFAHFIPTRCCNKWHDYAIIQVFRTFLPWIAEWTKITREVNDRWPVPHKLKKIFNGFRCVWHFIAESRYLVEHFPIIRLVRIQLIGIWVISLNESFLYGWEYSYIIGKRNSSSLIETLNWNEILNMSRSTLLNKISILSLKK